MTTGAGKLASSASKAPQTRKKEEEASRNCKAGEAQSRSAGSHIVFVYAHPSGGKGPHPAKATVGLCNID